MNGARQTGDREQWRVPVLMGSVRLSLQGVNEYELVTRKVGKKLVAVLKLNYFTKVCICSVLDVPARGYEVRIIWTPAPFC